MRKSLILSLMTIVLLALAFFRPLRFIDNIWYDLHFTFAAREASGDVVVVGLDPQSIEKFGALPWNRSTMAALVDKINEGNPAAVALDFLFPRRDGQAENDSLAAVFSRTQRLVLPFRADDISAARETVHQPIPAGLFPYRIGAFENRELLGDLQYYSARSVSSADTLFTPYARYGGFLNVSTSSSSQKLREAIQVIAAGNEFFPSFGIAAVAARLGAAPEELILDGRGNLRIRDIAVPLSSYAASTAINFRSEKTPVPAVSAAAVLDGTCDITRFEGKLVFVGVTDPAAGADFFTTPLGPQVPGVTVWATIALDILQGRILREPSLPLAIPGLVMMLLIFPGGAMLFSSGRRRSALIIGSMLVIVGFLLSIVLFRSACIIWNFAPLVYAWLFMLLWLAALRADPSLASGGRITIDTLALPSGALPPPPEKNTPLENLPPTATTGFVTRLLSEGKNADTATAPAVEKGTLSGTVVEVNREDLAPQGHPKPLAADIGDLPRDLAGGTIIRLLGTGGMADVYQVWKERLETYRAVKVMKPGFSDNFLSRFETEIRIIAKLDHPNIVHCYNVGEWHTLPYLEMEFIYGCSMEEVLHKCRLLTVEQALITGILICRALHYAHTQVLTIYGKTYNGIIHRDLKPANILLSRSGQIKLTDFGIARPAEVSLHTVEAGSVVGTLPYLAPEQLDGNNLTPGADIYALGVTLYELIAGERAFPQTEITGLLRAKSGGIYKPLARTVQIPADVAQIIDTAMSTDPSKRPPSARALGEALEGAFVKMSGTNGTQHIASLVKRIWNIG
jgi:serine/threonine-protein kinase